MRINLIIDRIELEQAILKTTDGLTSIIWPRVLLPEEAHEGMSLAFNILLSEKDTEERRQRAKDILNEILDIGQ